MLHELEDERDVDVDRALELGQRPDVASGHLETGVPLELRVELLSDVYDQPVLVMEQAFPDCR